MNNVRDHVRIGPMPSLGTYPLCNRSVARASRLPRKAKAFAASVERLGFDTVATLSAPSSNNLQRQHQNFICTDFRSPSGDMPILIRRHAYPRRDPTCLRMPGFGYLEFWGDMVYAHYALAEDSALLLARILLYYGEQHSSSPIPHSVVEA